jgi:CMP-N-acetylneuraminic acid synthetase
MNKIVAFVPIKLNSERLPSKNILDFDGKPLAYYIFETLLKVKNLAHVYVYCSTFEIMNYLPKGVKYLKRDPIFDSNQTKGLPIWKSFVELIDADYYILAHTTAPFLSLNTLQSVVDNFLFKSSWDSAFSVKKEQTFVWYDNKPLNYSLNDTPRTQDVKPVYIETSGFYLFNKDTLNKNKRIGDYPLLVEVSHIESIDIDEKEDFEFALKIKKTLDTL